MKKLWNPKFVSKLWNLKLMNYHKDLQSSHDCEGMDKPAKENTVIWRPKSKIPQANYNTPLPNIFKMAKHIEISRKKKKAVNFLNGDHNPIHSWQIFRIAKWALKFDKKEQNQEKKLPDKRRLSSNWARGTNWVRCLFPVHLVCCFVSFNTRKTTGAHKTTWACVRFNLHSLHSGWLEFWAVAGESSRSSMGERLRALAVYLEDLVVNWVKERVNHV